MEHFPFSSEQNFFTTMSEVRIHIKNVLTFVQFSDSESGFSEVLLPSNKEEIKAVEVDIQNSSTFFVSILLPYMWIHVSSKNMLQKLIDRIGTDLMMWQPKNVSKSEFHSAVSVIQPAVSAQYGK